jgi:hypothetical protein
MDQREVLGAKWHELGPLLQRRFWKPVRSMMEIFDVLPLAAGLILFVLFATDGQFREIYIAYLEGPRHSVAGWIGSIVGAAAVLALISAVLSEAHFSLSTMRINVIYSSYSNPDANSKLRSLQRTAAFVLCFMPWLGLTVGLFGARNFVADRYCQLLSQMPASQLHDMQHLLMPGGGPIAIAIIFLGTATALFCCVDQKNRIAQRAVALIAPPLAALLLVLFTDWLIPSINQYWSILFCAVTLCATVAYFIVYQRLYWGRSGPVFTRANGKAGDASALAPDIYVPKTFSQRLALWVLSPFASFVRPEYSTGIGLYKRRQQTLFAWAFLPWLFFALYFVIVPNFAPSWQSADDWYRTQAQAQCPIALTSVPVPGHWTIFPVAMCWTIGIGLFVALLLNSLSERWMLRRALVISLVVFLVIAAKLASMLDVDTVVLIYRAIGPLGTVSLQLLFLIATFALLAWLSQRSGFPALTLVILAMVVCAVFPDYVGWVATALGVLSLIFAITAFMSRLVAVGCVALVLPILGLIQWHELRTDQKVGQNPNTVATGAVDPLAVKFQFECWLRQRGIAVTDKAAAAALNHACPSQEAQAAPPGREKYPVFIIAAEGGGIYAASAASMFLAQLQQDSPHFAAHVFAISGVSGGAIGATIFQALDKAEAAYSASRPTRKTLPQKVTAIMEDDHFSPVVGSIFPEMLGSSLGRAGSLVASFQLSAAARDARTGNILKGSFADDWAYNEGVPALVLNATWVETGFRVAFAPFHLHSIDESLYSFSDEWMPDEDCPTKADQQTCVSLMKAAAVSARFPLVLPPFSTEMTDGKRWNFVDGGYADNSGATTALDLYRTLKTVDPQDVDLRVVLITSSTPQPNLVTTDISGTVFRDTIAPIDAIMKVREDLGNDAVARACSEIYQPSTSSQNGGMRAGERAVLSRRTDQQQEENETCIEHSGELNGPLQIVEIQDQTYGLSLGWKISQTSFAVVSWMLGKPSACYTDPHNISAAADSTSESLAGAQSENKQLTWQIVNRNSCVESAIQRLVGDASPTGKPAAQL